MPMRSYCTWWAHRYVFANGEAGGYQVLITKTSGRVAGYSDPTCFPGA